MLYSLNKTRQFFVLFLVCTVLASCGIISRSGPTAREIRSGSVENGGDVHIIDVTDEVADLASRDQSLGFSTAFLNAGAPSVDTIHSGDILAITIWENVDNGVFATQGQRVTTLPALRVDQLGNIFVPYAGTIRANGRTGDDLRQDITRQLAPQTPDPQVEVRREAGDGATVSILGGVTGQGVFPITAINRRLTGMIANAGGISLDPSIVKITIRRGQHLGQIWLQDLFDNPGNDIPLHSGDRIFIEKDERYFVSLGATGQRRIGFSTNKPTAIEALATVGGLQGGTSNPKGIFVFRVEPPEIANRVLGRTDIIEPQRFVYVLDLTTETTMFTPQNFHIVDQDTIFVTEAPYVAFRKVLGTVLGSLNAFSSLDNAVDSAVGAFE